MSILTILGIAAGLSMDAFAVSISYGCSPQRLLVKHMLLISFSFGLFQAFMPVIGWQTGRLFSDMINTYDHWIAFALLAYIGIRMIIEGMKNSGENNPSCSSDINEMDLKKLLILSIATSIDALAVGISLSLIGYDILVPAGIIGITTFVFSYIGVTMGCRLQGIFGKRVEIAGGLILIIIGLKIIFEHTL